MQTGRRSGVPGRCGPGSGFRSGRRPGRKGFGPDFGPAVRSAGQRVVPAPARRRCGFPAGSATPHRRCTALSRHRGVTWGSEPAPGGGCGQWGGQRPGTPPVGPVVCVPRKVSLGAYLGAPGRIGGTDSSDVRHIKRIFVLIVAMRTGVHQVKVNTIHKGSLSSLCVIRRCGGWARACWAGTAVSVAAGGPVACGTAMAGQAARPGRRRRCE
jgi:hypothetical protein